MKRELKLEDPKHLASLKSQTKMIVEQVLNSGGRGGYSDIHL